MSKIKVLTVMFDVTHLPQEAINELKLAVEVQAEQIITEDQEEYEADLINVSVREVDAEDM